VCFASTDMGWCFTLRSFAKMYAETYGAFHLYLSPICCDSELRLGKLDVAGFADRLWGDIYFNDDTRKFTRKAADPESPRTFVRFVLDPLYRLYSQVLSEETDNLKDTLAELNIHLKPVMYKMDVRPLLKAVLDQFFGPATGLIDMIAEWIPDPADSAAAKVSFVL
jgi:116 kDa U5 small nuclear ribonucleoprotein component